MSHLERASPIYITFEKSNPQIYRSKIGVLLEVRSPLHTYRTALTPLEALRSR
jgi:hypothetical protein